MQRTSPGARLAGDSVKILPFSFAWECPLRKMTTNWRCFEALEGDMKTYLQDAKVSKDLPGTGSGNGYGAAGSLGSPCGNIFRRNHDNSAFAHVVATAILLRVIADDRLGMPDKV